MARIFPTRLNTAASGGSRVTSSFDPLSFHVQSLNGSTFLPDSFHHNRSKQLNSLTKIVGGLLVGTLKWILNVVPNCPSSTELISGAGRGVVDGDGVEVGEAVGVELAAAPVGRGVVEWDPVEVGEAVGVPLGEALLGLGVPEGDLVDVGVPVGVPLGVSEGDLVGIGVPVGMPIGVPPLGLPVSEGGAVDVGVPVGITVGAASLGGVNVQLPAAYQK